MKRQLFQILVCLGVFSCSVSGPLREDKTAEGYQLSTPGGWEKAKWDVDADHVFVHRTRNTVLNVNSMCDRYANASLKSLLKAAVGPLREREVLSEEYVEVDGRRALQQRLKASLDGVPVELLITVLRKDNCLFDFQMQRAGELSEKDLKSYEELLSSFHYSKYGSARK